jgi:hypothetical protein
MAEENAAPHTLTEQEQPSEKSSSNFDLLRVPLRSAVVNLWAREQASKPCLLH